MKIWTGILIGFIVGLLVGIPTIINRNGWRDLAQKCIVEKSELYVDLLEPTVCEKSYEDLLDLYDKQTADYNEFTGGCFDLLDDWGESYEDLLDDCYNINYETEDFIVVGGIEYDCTYNRYNCIDFPEWADAQTLFTYCKTEGKGDVHHLDLDYDGTACDNLKWEV